MKEVDTAKKRRIITWIIILIVLFILLTGLCLFIFSDMIRSCFSSANECIPSRSLDSMERVQERNESMSKKSMERAKSMGGTGSVGGVELNEKNMDPDDLGEAMEKMESNRW